jgi:hypothetical protein
VHLVCAERAVLEAVGLQNLVVAEVEGALHLCNAALHGVVAVAATGLAPHEVRDEGPAVVAVAAGVVLGHHGLVALHQDDPVAVQVVLVLQEHLGRPPRLLCEQQVDERALVVGLERGPPGERGREHLPGLHAHRALGTHGSPSVQQIQRPLTVPEQEAARVEPHPALLRVDHLVEAVQHHVHVAVLGHGELEHHVREHGVGVHPPQPLHLRVRQHELAQQRQLGPEPSHLVVQVRHVVEDVDVMHPAVVQLVLQALEQKVVAHGIIARLRLRPRHQQDPVPAAAVGSHAGVPLQPQRALRVPVADRSAQRVRDATRVRLWIPLVLLLARVAEHTSRLARALGLHTMTYRVRRPTVRPCKTAGANRPPQDQHRDEPAQDGHSKIVHRLLQLPTFGDGPFCGVRRQHRPRVPIHRASPGENVFLDAMIFFHSFPPCLNSIPSKSLPNPSPRMPTILPTLFPFISILITK